MTIAQIYQNGRHYDRLFDNPVHPFWFEQAESTGGPILELGSGTGRIAIPLAQQGYTVTGIEGSPSMLEEARRKAALANVAIDFRLADIREFDLANRYALVILAGHTICDLLTLADFEACMACVRRHLLPHGRFLVEEFVPDLTLLTQGPNDRRLFSDYDDPDGRGHIVVMQTCSYDPATQIRHNRTHHLYPGEAEEKVGTLPQRMYFPQELDALFKYNGFEITHKYGGFDRRPFDASATRQLFVLSLSDTTPYPSTTHLPNQP